MFVKAVSGFRSESGGTVAEGETATVSDSFGRELIAMRKAVEASASKPIDTIRPRSRSGKNKAADSAGGE